MKYGTASLVGISLGGFLLFASTTHATEHKIENVSEAKWGAAPPMLPPGAKIEVLQGNPTGDTLYTVRLNFPANYKIPAHSHPKDELVTVLSGELYMGMGDKLNPKTATGLTVGGFGLGHLGGAADGDDRGRPDHERDQTGGLARCLRRRDDIGRARVVV